MSEKPAEIPVPEETTEKTTELNSDALLSLPPQPKVTDRCGQTYPLITHNWPHTVHPDLAEDEAEDPAASAERAAQPQVGQGHHGQGGRAGKIQSV